MIKTTKEDFQLFKTECQKWIQLLGLSSWSVTYRKKKLNGSNAECKGYIEGSMAVIDLSDKIDKRAHINRYAHHEVRELQLWPLRELLWKMGVSNEMVNQHFHVLINQEEQFLIDGGVLC